MSPQTITFLGASQGVGLSALKSSLAASSTCITLLRNPSKFDTIFPPTTRPANLIIKQGNAHSQPDVLPCLTLPNDPSRFVDSIFFSIGGAPAPPFYNTTDDPDVCKKGIATLLSALQTLRAQGVNGDPLIIAVSTTSHSRFGRDIKPLMIPVYWYFVKVAAADKQVMEDRLLASEERNWMLVRPSHLTDGSTGENVASMNKVRVGVEDLEKGVEKLEVGYAISREDVGRWCFEEGLRDGKVREGYLRKAVSITN